MHYQRFMNHGDVHYQRPPRPRRERKPCSVTGCAQPAIARSWCGGHWSRWKRLGDVQSDLPLRPQAPRYGSTPCAIEGCESVADSRGWCSYHYQRWLRVGDPMKRFKRSRHDPVPACKVEDCDKPFDAAGFCNGHYARWRKHGTPMEHRPLGEREPARPCSVRDCDRVTQSHNMCVRHVQRWKRYGDPLAGQPLRLFLPPGTLCAEAGCDNVVYCRGLCGPHYGRTRDPMKKRLRQGLRRARKQRNLAIPFTKAQLLQRLAYWGFRCWLCAEEYAEIDHVKPVARGGGHLLANLRPICSGCNLRKGARWPLGPIEISLLRSRASEAA